MVLARVLSVKPSMAPGLPVPISLSSAPPKVAEPKTLMTAGVLPFIGARPLFLTFLCVIGDQNNLKWPDAE